MSFDHIDDLAQLDEDCRSHPLYVAASNLTSWAWCDSRVSLDRQKLRELLAEDEEGAGYLPDEQQCMEFICGADDGEPPAKLVADFPKTHAYLEEVWA